jgi:uncharacterized protein YqjF (DUF2071 family)
MNLLKRIPIHYKGELHDVRLINFSVSMDELNGKVPANIKVRDFGGRAMISMVDVKLKNMHPVSLPPFLNFNYRHIAFRLLVDDSEYNNGANKGIFFFRSFTDKPLIVTGGKLFTDYNLEQAHIEEHQNEVLLRQGQDHVKYCLDETPATVSDALRQTVGALDRAYSILGDAIRVTEIQREKWPIEPVSCTGFENTFFKTAKFEGAFRVHETIYYDWLPPKAIG